MTIVEVDQRARLPFLLHDVATRLAGVHVTGVVLDSARTFVRSTLAARRFGDVAGGLATRLGDLAAGTSDEIAVRKATGEGIREVTPAEAEAQLHALWVPSNCAVAIAGDLTDLDLRTLLERDFGGLAPGNPQPELPEENLHAAARSEEWQGLPHVCGGVGILAPGLADTLSPSFYLATITMAGWLTKYLGLPAAPLRSRFEYVPLDEPELVRYYPKVDPAKPDVPDMVAEFNRWLDDYGYTSVSVTMMREVAGGVEWMFGGPLTFSQRRMARGGGELLSLLAGSMSTRVVFRGDDFWDLYRRRLESTLVLPQTFIPWMRDPAHQVGIVLTPGR